jgi:membrane peptidoglycan carboxypeptidase
LAGVKDSIETAEAMGITSLKDPNRYGLTLVLGGGEVSLLELTSAYGVFANDGIRNPYRSILRIEDSKGNTIEDFKTNPVQAIPPQPARQISDILSDPKVMVDSLKNTVSNLNRQVAVKTGTTNDYRDVWIEGYTPNIVVGAWAGKNDNTPMDRKVAGLIITPVWGAFMTEINKSLEKETFKNPEPDPQDIKPVLRGIWKGGVTYKIDSISKKLATDLTPPELQQEIILPSVHSILHWVDKTNPNGEIPKDPKQDSQYEYWEYGVRKWFDEWATNNPNFQETLNVEIPTQTDDVHTLENSPKINITSPKNTDIVSARNRVSVQISYSGKYPIKKSELYINNKYISTSEKIPNLLTFIPQDIGITQDKIIIKVVTFDAVLNRAESSIDINITN